MFEEATRHGNRTGRTQSWVKERQWARVIKGTVPRHFQNTNVRPLRLVLTSCRIRAFAFEQRFELNGTLASRLAGRVSLARDHGRRRRRDVARS